MQESTLHRFPAPQGLQQRQLLQLQRPSTLLMPTPATCASPAMPSLLNRSASVHIKHTVAVAVADCSLWTLTSQLPGFTHKGMPAHRSASAHHKQPAAATAPDHLHLTCTSIPAQFLCLCVLQRRSSWCSLPLLAVHSQCHPCSTGLRLPIRSVQ